MLKREWQNPKDNKEKGPKVYKERNTKLNFLLEIWYNRRKTSRWAYLQPNNPPLINARNIPNKTFSEMRQRRKPKAIAFQRWLPSQTVPLLAIHIHGRGPLLITTLWHKASDICKESTQPFCLRVSLSNLSSFFKISLLTWYDHYEVAQVKLHGVLFSNCLQIILFKTFS